MGDIQPNEQKVKIPYMESQKMNIDTIAKLHNEITQLKQAVLYGNLLRSINQQDCLCKYDTSEYPCNSCAAKEILKEFGHVV